VSLTALVVIVSTQRFMECGAFRGLMWRKSTSHGAKRRRFVVACPNCPHWFVFAPSSMIAAMQARRARKTGDDPSSGAR
jgi:hypothetical protein